MGYWKIEADWLFDGDNLRTDVVLVGKGTGEIEAVVPASEAGEDVQCFSGLICPGFVNTHCHLELSHMSGVIPEGTGMVDFLLQVMGRRGEVGKDPLEAARWADGHMYEEGIVAVGDISNNISTLPIKVGSRLYYHTFVETMGFLPASAEARMAQARQVYDAACRIMGVEAVSLVPHAPYSVSRALFEGLNGTLGGGILSIHNQESEAENQFYREATGDFLRLYGALGQDIGFFRPYGKTSLETYLPWLDEPSAVLLVHNVASKKNDVTFARQLAEERGQRLFWCLCPGANQYIQRALPPVDMLRGEGCTITLGTDSLASNRGLSILDEMRLLQEGFPGLPLEELLRWATVNGAKALGIEGTYGRFAPGTLPGILSIGPFDGQRITAETRVKRLQL